MTQSCDAYLIDVGFLCSSLFKKYARNALRKVPFYYYCQKVKIKNYDGKGSLSTITVIM